MAHLTTPLGTRRRPTTIRNSHNLRRAEADAISGLSTRPGFRSVGPGTDINAAGGRARRFDYYTEASDGSEVKARTVLFARDDVGYLVTFATLPANFEMEVAALDVALQGWRFTD